MEQKAKKFMSNKRKFALWIDTQSFLAIKNRYVCRGKEDLNHTNRKEISGSVQVIKMPLVHKKHIFILRCRSKPLLSGDYAQVPNLRAPFIFHTHPEESCVSSSDLFVAAVVFPPSNHDLALLLKNPKRHRFSAILTKEGIFGVWVKKRFKKPFAKKWARLADILDRSEANITALFEKEWMRNQKKLTEEEERGQK